MAKSRKVIITCAVTGSIHTPSMSPHLPVTPDEIAEGAIAAAEAGATVLHLHARDPEDGRPTQDPDVFMKFLPRIKQATEAVVNITTGGGPARTRARAASPWTTRSPSSGPTCKTCLWYTTPRTLRAGATAAAYGGPVGVARTSP